MGRLLAVPINVIGCRGTQGTNTLAYLWIELNKKIFLELTPRPTVVKHFTAVFDECS